MRAAVLSAPRPSSRRPLEITEVPDPEVQPGDVLIDVIACGVCRTDLQLCEGDLTAQILPIIPGHQIVGTVAGRGANVVDVGIGDRVCVAWIASTCGTCRFCISGRENLCDHARFTGWHRNGGFAERVVARSEYVLALPDTFDAVGAAPLLCGGAIGLRSLRVSGIQPGGRLGLYGFGASATCAIQIARHWDCDVSVVTRSATEQRRALELGAAWAGGYDDHPPEPLDAAITFAPVGSAVVAALKALDKGAVVAINAIHLDHIPMFDYDHLWWERQLRSVANVTRSDVAELMQLAASIPIRTTTEEFTLTESNEALQAISSGSVAGTAVLRIGN